MSQLSFQLSGQASKRGLIPRVPAPDRLLADIETWLRAEYPDVVRSTRTRTSTSGDRQLLIGLHPAADDLAIISSELGQIYVSTTLGPVGPGHQTFVARLMARIATDHEIIWTSELADRDEPGPDLATTGERSNAERTYLAWLGTGLIRARDLRATGGAGIHLGTPPGVRFDVDDRLVTSLGPRDDAWLDRAIADSRVALDVTPWWADATDARFLLNRALCLMWTQVRWRMPVDDAEREVNDEVLRMLARAFPLDPSLPFPWREWKQLVDQRGTVDAMARQVETRAARAPGGPLIGYRRKPVSVIHEGWEIEVPGTFAERRTDDEWWGGEAGRSITIAATATGTEQGPMSAEEFLHQVAPDLGEDALGHEEGEVRGRARLTTDASSGLEVGVLEGYSAVTGRGAAIRIVFDDSADWRWALDIWRALAPARGEALART